MKEVSLRPEQGTGALCNDGVDPHASARYSSHMRLLNTWHMASAITELNSTTVSH